MDIIKNKFILNRNLLKKDQNMLLDLVFINKIVIIIKYKNYSH